MKTIFRSLSMAAVVAVVAVTGAFAQNVCDDLDGATAKYDGFLKAYSSKDIKQLPAIKASLADGKEFLEKWGACESWKEQVAFVKPWVPRVEVVVKDMEDFLVLEPKFKRFDAGVAADNVDEIYGAGKEILAVQPGNQNIKYVMAVSSVVDIAKAVQAKTTSKHASEALNHAKSLYDQMKSGSLKFNRKLGAADSIGVLKWERTREEALSQLAYTIGFVNYYGLNNKKAALPQYYEVTQIAGFYKNYPPVYVTISDYYRDEAENIGKEIVTLTNEYNAMVDSVKKLGNTPEDQEKAKQLDVDIKAKDAQIKAKEALFNGYIERGMDALARAHKVAKDDTPPAKTYKDALFKDLQAMYNRRFPTKAAAFNEWVTATTAKPLPDPTSTVQPVSDEPATTTTTGTGTGIGAANGTGVGAATGTGIGAANGTGAAPKAGPTAKVKP